MRRTAAIVMVAVVGFGVAACGSSKGSASSADTQAPATTTAAPTSAPTEAQLNQLVLTAAQVGSGWTASPIDDGGSSALPACLSELEGSSQNGPQGQGQFDQADGGYFFESVGYAGPDTIATEFANVKSTLDGCHDVSIQTSGTTVTGTMQPVALTAGDMSAGYQLTFTGAAGQTLNMYVGVVGVNGYELSTAVGSMTGADPSTFDALTAQAVAKIKSGGGQSA